MNNQKFRTPLLPEGASWIIGAIFGLIVFVLLYLTNFLSALESIIIAALVVVALGIGLNMWDSRSQYAQKAKKEFSITNELLIEISLAERKIKSQATKQTLEGIIKKALALLDEIKTKLDDEVLSATSSLNVALSNVKTAANSIEDLESSFTPDPQTINAANQSLQTINSWLDEADKELHSGSKTSLQAVIERMNSYRFKSFK